MRHEAPVPVPLGETMGDQLGFETLETGPERVRSRFEVTNRVRQPLGIVHGGAYAALAEGMTSRATWDAVSPEGMVALGLSNQTSYLRPIAAGTVTAEARSIHRGRTTWVWEVEFRDDEGRLCAVSRLTIAVRPIRDGGPAEP